MECTTWGLERRPRNINMASIGLGDTQIALVFLFPDLFRVNFCLSYRAQPPAMKLTAGFITLLLSGSFVSASPAPKPSTQSAPPKHAATHRPPPTKPSESSAPTSSVDWTKLNCNDPTATDEHMDSKERWIKSGAGEAWKKGAENFEHHGDRPFSQSLSDFFHGPVNVLCGQHLGDETNCQNIPDCSNTAAHEFKSAGSYLVVRSMFTLNQVSCESDISMKANANARTRDTRTSGMPSTKPRITSTRPR